jgi:hypothetical protein
MADSIIFDIKGNDGLSPILDKNQRKADSLRQTLSIAGGAFIAGAAIKGFELLSDAISSAIGIAEDSIRASAEQEQATQNLNTALALTGQFSKESSKQIQDLASEIQNLTTLEDDAVLGAAALIQNLGMLSVDGLDRATRAAVDLSAALGIDLASAATLVGKAANGNVGAFARYGIEVVKGRNETETFANTLTKLETAFGGAAAAQARTFGGSLTQLKNAVGEAKESIGDVITQNPAVIAAFKTAQAAVVDLANSFKASFGGDTSEQVAGFFRATLDGVNALVLVADSIGRAFDASINLALGSIRILALGIVTPVAGVLELIAAIPGIGGAFKGAADAATAEMLRLSEAVDSNIKGLNDSVSGDTFLSGLSLGIAEARTNFDVFFNEIKNAPPIVSKVSVQGPTEEETLEVINQRKALAAEIAALDAQLALDAQAQEEQLRIAEREARGINQEQEILDLVAFQERKNVIEYEAQLAKNEITLTGEAKRLADIKALQELQLKNGALNAKKQVDQQKLLASEERTVFAARISAFQGFASLGLALTKQGSREAKAISTAQALVSTYAGAAQVLGDPKIPVLAKPAFVAGIIAQGLAQVANINKQSFASGGIVGGEFSGASMGQDNVQITARKDEMFLNAQQQKNLFEMINNGGIGGGPIIVQIDGREIAKAVRTQKEMGFAI